MHANWIFAETSPSAPGTAASSQPVQNTASWAPAGVAAPLHEFDAINCVLEIGATATGGTLDVYVQVSADEGITWTDIIHFKQHLTGDGNVIYEAPMSNATTTTAPTAVGKNLNPALSAGTTGTVINGAFSDRMRLVMVAGSGTTVGVTVNMKLFAQTSQRVMG